MPHRTCVLFDAHRFDDFTRHNLQRMRAECRGMADVYLIYSGSEPLPDDVAAAPWVRAWDPFDAVAAGPKRIPHSREEILSQYGLRAMNSEVKTLQFIASAGSRYDLYVRFEYDVWSLLPYGAIVWLVAHAMLDRAFGAFYLRTRAADPAWHWWHSQVWWPVGLALPRLAGLMCLFAIRREVAEGVAQVYARGVAGHVELTLPSAVVAAGHGPAELCSLDRLFCRDAPAASSERRYRAPFNCEAAEFAANCHLFHPVKTLAEAEALRAGLEGTPLPVLRATPGHGA
jgi:hypothetical protein